MRWLENLAIRWLKRRGIVVLPRSFIGVAMGFATATYREESFDGRHRWTTYRITVPSGFSQIVLNHSMLSKEN